MASYSKWPEELSNVNTFTSFHQTCVRLEPKNVEVFLKLRKVNVNEPLRYPDCYSFTPLHLIIHMDPKEKSSERIKIIRTLILYGSELDARDINGNTPLHIAAMNLVSRLPVFEILIRNKADTTVINNVGKTPFDIMMSHDVKWKDLELILKKSPQSFNPCKGKSMIPRFVLCDIVFSNSTLRKLFLDKILENSRLENFSQMKRNALHNIILLTDMDDNIPIYLPDEERRRRQSKLDYPALVEGLIRIGFDVNYQDEIGKTALHLAVQFQNFEAIKALIQRGADIQIVDKAGESPLSISRNIFSNRHQFSDLGEVVATSIHFTFLRHLNNLNNCV